MLNQIASYFHGDTNFQTAVIVLVYSLSAAFVLGGIGGLINAFMPKKTIVRDYD